MKKMKISLIALAAAMACVPFAGSAQQIPGGGMPGIAVAGSVDNSMLPDAIRSFLDKHYPSVEIIKSEREFESGEYEIDLANGVDIEFTSTGTVKEISAPGNKALAEDVVRHVLPRATVDHLRKNGFLAAVHEIDVSRRGGYKVQLVKAQPDEIIYDADGLFIAFDY